MILLILLLLLLFFITPEGSTIWLRCM